MAVRSELLLLTLLLLPGLAHAAELDVGEPKRSVDGVCALPVGDYELRYYCDEGTRLDKNRYRPGDDRVHQPENVPAEVVCPALGLLSCDGEVLARSFPGDGPPFKRGSLAKVVDKLLDGEQWAVGGRTFTLMEPPLPIEVAHAEGGDLMVDGVLRPWGSSDPLVQRAHKATAGCEVEDAGRPIRAEPLPWPPILEVKGQELRRGGRLGTLRLEDLHGLFPEALCQDQLPKLVDLQDLMPTLEQDSERVTLDGWEGWGGPMGGLTESEVQVTALSVCGIRLDRGGWTVDIEGACEGGTVSEVPATVCWLLPELECDGSLYGALAGKDFAEKLGAEPMSLRDGGHRLGSVSFVVVDEPENSWLLAGLGLAGAVFVGMVGGVAARRRKPGARSMPARRKEEPAREADVARRLERLETLVRSLPAPVDPMASIEELRRLLADVSFDVKGIADTVEPPPPEFIQLDPEVKQRWAGAAAMLGLDAAPDELGLEASLRLLAVLERVRRQLVLLRDRVETLNGFEAFQRRYDVRLLDLGGGGRCAETDVARRLDRLREEVLAGELGEAEVRDRFEGWLLNRSTNGIFHILRGALVLEAYRPRWRKRLAPLRTAAELLHDCADALGVPLDDLYLGVPVREDGEAELRAQPIVFADDEGFQSRRDRVPGMMAADIQEWGIRGRSKTIYVVATSV